MDLDFNQDQVLLKDSISRMCSQFSNLIEVRSLEGTEPGYSQLFWQQLKDLGITGMNISYQLSLYIINTNCNIRI